MVTKDIDSKVAQRIVAEINSNYREVLKHSNKNLADKHIKNGTDSYDDLQWDYDNCGSYKNSDWGE